MWHDTEILDRERLESQQIVRLSTNKISEITRGSLLNQS